MIDFGVVFGRLIAFALDRMDMDQAASVFVFGFPQDGFQFFLIGAVNRSQIVETEIFKQVFAHDPFFKTLFELSRPHDQVFADQRDFPEKSLGLVF